MFSIIIPLYNKEKYITRTLDAVLRQTMNAYEVLIVNDGSTDGSVALIEPYLSDQRFRLIHQQNTGVSGARNNGIKHARFDLIAFLDADDIWHPEYLAFQRKALEKNPEAGISATDYLTVPPDFNAGQIPENPEYKDAVLLKDYFKYAYRNSVFWTSATVIRKSVFEKVTPFHTQLATGEDLDLWFRIMIYYDGIKVPVQLAYYVNSDNTYNNRFNFSSIEKNIVYSMLELYKPFFHVSKPYLHSFIYFFVLNHSIHYYFMAAYHDQAKKIIKQIPLKYKLRKGRFWLFLLPFAVAKPVYHQIMSGKQA